MIDKKFKEYFPTKQIYNSHVSYPHTHLNWYFKH